MRAYNWKTKGGKSLRGLGGTDAEHVSMGKVTIQRAMTAADEAMQQAEDGNCSRAMNSLLLAHNWLGASNAHHGSTTAATLLTAHRPLRTKIGEADTAVLHTCQPRWRFARVPGAVGDLDTPLGTIRTPYLWALALAAGFYLWQKK